MQASLNSKQRVQQSSFLMNAFNSIWRIHHSVCVVHVSVRVCVVHVSVRVRGACTFIPVCAFAFVRKRFN